MNGWYGRCYTVSIVALVLLACVAGSSYAARVEIEAGATAMVIDDGAESPSRHLVRFDLPEYLAEAGIELAVAEFSADVECDSEVGGLTLNAYFVTEDWEAGLVDWTGLDGSGEEPFDRGLHAMWGVAAGDSSLVRLDVTEMVATWANDSTTNRGFVLVPSVGEEAVIRPSLAGGGTWRAARLTIWYTPQAVLAESDAGGLR